MTGLRVHPGYAVLTAIALIVGAGLVLVQTRTFAPPALSAAGHQQDLSPSTPGISGVARVIDGDTIDIRGTHVRLSGIDAPESKQTCVTDNKQYQCGMQATEALIRLIGSNTVDCEQTGKDRNGRTIGRCLVGSSDVGGWMVEHGWAVAYRRFSLEYVDQEKRAREQKQGLWAGSFTTPEEWRRMRREGGMQ